VVKQSCCREKGSNKTPSKNDACTTKRKPPKLKRDEPASPVNHAATCLKLSDDGHVSFSSPPLYSVDVDVFYHKRAWQKRSGLDLIEAVQRFAACNKMGVKME
jgi:hypothetical protein